MSALGDDYTIDLPPGTPVEQVMGLIKWLARVEDHPELNEDDRKVARAIALEAAEKIAREAGLGGV